MNLLGAINYDPSSAVSKVTTSLIAMTAFDTTNLRIAFTVPAHGIVMVRLVCIHHGSTTTAQVLLGALEGSTLRGRAPVSGNLLGTAIATTRTKLEASYIITGLTPGAVNWDAAYGVEIVSSANGAIKYGGPNNTTTDDAFGGFEFEIWDPRPLPTAAPAAVNGLLTAPTTANVGLADVARILGTVVSTPATAGILDVNVKNIDNDAASASGTVTFPNATLASTTNITAATGIDITKILGTAISTPATAGILDVNVKNMNNVAGTPITTIQAVQGLATDGVIPTVTNLTNAPTAGDFTAVMKTSLNAATPAVTVSDKTGFSLSTAGILAIWHQLTSAIVTVGTIGKLILDNLDATISSRTKPADTQAAVTLVTTTTNLTTNNDKTGYGLSSAAIQAIWDALTSALTTIGSIGKLLVDNINATISSRLATAGYTAPDNAGIAAIKAKTDNLPSDPADESILEGLIAAVQADTDNIQVRLPSALSANGNIKADLKEIDEQTTNGNNATLNLKQLNVQNNNGSAVLIYSNGGNGIGLDILGNNNTGFRVSGGFNSEAVSLEGDGFGSGMSINGGIGGQGLAISAGNNGNGLKIDSQNGEAVYFRSNITGIGLLIQSTDSSDGIKVESTGGGKSVNVPNDIAVSDGNLTLTNIAKKVLTLDWTTVTGEAARSVLNALRKLRNKVVFDGVATLSVKKEDDVTNAYTQPVATDAAQNPFKELG